VTPDPAANDIPATTLGNLLRAWGDAKEAPPTAILAAIVHDLAVSSVGGRRPALEVDVDGVWIDADGRVGADVDPSVPALAELMELGLSGTSPGRTGDLMPPGAQSALDRFRAWDGSHDDGCEALADWLRQSFGPLPDADEVVRCCRASAPLDPHAPTMRPARRPWPSAPPREALSELPVPPPEAEDPSVEDAAPPPADDVPLGRDDPGTPAPSEPEPASSDSLEIPPPVAADSIEPTTLASAHPVELGTPEVEARESDVNASTASDSSLPEFSVPPPVSSRDGDSGDLPDADTSSGERPVVRRELPSRREATVSVVSAPAARRSARPLADRGDSILVPAEGSSARGWGLFLLGVVVAVGLYFLLTS